jgi:uncharacterized membrane protein YkvA (DUF1232 family)
MVTGNGKRSVISNKWSLRVKILTLYYALKDAGTPWYAKLTAITSIVYLVSPIDLLPDVIPLAGYIDDLVVVPFLMSVATRLLPDSVKQASELKARRQSRKLGWIIIAAVILLVLIIIGIYFLVRSDTGYL